MLRPRQRRDLCIQTLEHRLMLASDLVPIEGAELAEIRQLDATDVVVSMHVTADDQIDGSEPTAAEQLREIWIDMTVDHYQHVFAQPVHCGPYIFSHRWADSAIDVLPATRLQLTTANDLGSDMVADYSTTNTQVEGIDEADIIETDGDFLYMVSGRHLLILDARTPDLVSPISRWAFETEPTTMYLAGDRLTVISQPNQFRTLSPLVIAPSYSLPWGTTTTITTIDISDRTSPQVVRTTELDGRLLDSRAKDGQLYLVLSQSLRVPPLEVIHTANLMSPQSVRWHGCYTESRYESEAEYRARLATLGDELLPTMTTYDAHGDVVFTGPILSSHERLRLGDGQAASDWSSVLSLDLAGQSDKPTDALGLVGQRVDGIYMSEESLYVYGHDSTWHSSGDTTTITKVSMESGYLTWEAEGTIRGSILNSFSVDESNGLLRVATTEGRFGQNHLFVLSQRGVQLEVVGKIENLAPGERIYAARFMGNRAFIVTFRKVDPLFAVDLSDPSNPTVEGELKIPGFSDYLQPIDETHLISVGRGADVNSGLFQELQVSLFDVSDLSDPVLVDRYSFAGGRNTNSEARFDHHAVTYLSEYHTLAIPLRSDGWWSGNFGGVDNTPIFSGETTSAVFLLEVDSVEGISLLGQVDHPDRVRRSVQIGDMLMTIGEAVIKAYDLDVSTATSFELFVAAHAFDDQTEIPRDGQSHRVDVLANDRAADDADGSLKIVDAWLNHGHRGDVWWNLPLLLVDNTVRFEPVTSSITVQVSDDRQHLLITAENDADPWRWPSDVEIVYSIEDSAGTRSQASVRVVLAQAEDEENTPAEPEVSAEPASEADRDLDGPKSSREEPGERDVPASPATLNQQPAERMDIDNNGILSSRDVLLLIREFNSTGPQDVADDAPASLRRLDVSGDGVFSPQDVLLVIAELNKGDEESELSGQATSTS